MPSPYTNAEAYDKLVLGTIPSPGVVTISGHDDTTPWKINSAKGTTGASMTRNGQDPRTFDASFLLVTDADFDDWESFQAVVDSLSAAPKPFALAVYHPDLARQRFTEVTKAMVGGMVHDGRGGATVKVKFIEYKPPKKRPAASPNAKPGAVSGPTATPDPNAAAKAELAGLLAQANGP